MKQAVPWGDPLGITNQQLEEWLDQAPEGVSLAGWCIENRVLDEPKYLEWAQNFYGLSILRTEFFESQAPRDLSRLMDDTWPAYVVPVADWEGVIFLACTEPCYNFQTPPSIQWVLAPVNKIESWRKELRTQPEASLIPTTLPEVPDSEVAQNAADTPQESAGETLNAASVESEVILSALDFNLGPSEEPAPKAKSAAAPAAAVPASEEGLSSAGFSLDGLDLKAFEFDPSKPESASLTTAPAPSVSTPEPKPEDSTTSFEPPMEEITKISPQPPLNLETPSAPVDAPIMAPPKVELTQRPVGAGQSIPTPPPPVRKETQSPSQQLDNQAIDVTQVGAIDENTASRSLEDTAKFALSRMREHFERAMLLTLTRGVLKPWRWDEKWLKDSKKRLEIDLSTPSMFRIVSDSQCPYHGHAVANPINDSFFLTWTQGRPPEHITILPLKKEDQLLGMLVGTCDKNKGKKMHLEDLEVIANQIALTMSKATKSKAAS